MIPTCVVAMLWFLTPMASFAQEIEVDHVWIHIERDIDVRNVFESKGFRMAGPSNIASTDLSSGFFQHTGQGTASTSYFFHNIYLELIRVEDEDLLRTAAPEAGYTLLNRPDTSPFGIGLRRIDSDSDTLPFETSSYWAEWMRPLVSLAVARRDDNWPGDPAIFVIPDYMRGDLRAEAQPELLLEAEHSVELNEVTSIRIHGPHLPSNSQAAQFLATAGLVEFVLAENHLLELEFDDRRDNRVDFRPTLPLVIYH